MAECKGSCLAVHKQTDFTKGGYDIVMITDVGTRGEKVIRIVNVYGQKETQRRERPCWKLRWW